MKPEYLIKTNMAQTLDGHTVEPAGNWTLGSTEDKRRMDRLRLWADALITSRRVIADDNPNLFARSVPHSPSHPKPVIILHNTETKLVSQRRIFNAPHPPGEFWVPENSKISSPKELLEEKEPPQLQKWKLYTYQNIAGIVASLTKRGYKKILLEGGPHLNGLFLNAGFIDELYITLVPFIWGDQSTDRIIESPSPLDRTRFRLISSDRRGDEMFLRYKKRHI